jgi:hypothetical protein
MFHYGRAPFVVGRNLKAHAAPVGTSLMWTLAYGDALV